MPGRRLTVRLVTFFAFLFLTPVWLRAQTEIHSPEAIAETASIKLLRGVANVVTSPLELPKQIERQTDAHGAPGALIGLLAGTGMIVYRAACGVIESVFFLVPSPGFYDPLPNPPYVWQDWHGATPAPNPTP